MTKEEQKKNEGKFIKICKNNGKNKFVVLQKIRWLTKKVKKIKQKIKELKYKRK